MKTFKYRLYPTKLQEKRLRVAIEDSRIVYNAILETKIKKWEKNKGTITQYEAQNLIPSIKKQNNLTAATHILRFAKDRLFDAYRHFFKKHNKFPRFKGKDHYSSIGLYAGQYDLKKDYVVIPKIGKIFIVKHRPFEGKPKQITIKKSATGKWYLCVFCEGDFSNPLPKTGKEVGIDLGLKSFAVLSDGTEIPRERFFKDEEDNLAKTQQQLSVKKKGSVEYKKKKLAVARVHERTANKRSNFVHQHTWKLVNDYDGMVLEDLSSKQMVKKSDKKIRKSIQDVAWGMFTTILPYKALNAGRKIVFVNPAYTSQTCSGCGHVQKRELKERTYSCPRCNLVMDRDLNAAKNIYRLGAASL